jgi:hypothetical protein
MKTLLFVLALFAVTAVRADDAVPISKVLEQVRKGKPQTATFVIAWKAVEGIKGSYNWTIEGTKFRWVKLYPDNRALKDAALDKKKKYRINGVLLEQWYGVYQVWVYDMEEVKAQEQPTPSSKAAASSDARAK